MAKLMMGTTEVLKVMMGTEEVTSLFVGSEDASISNCNGDPECECIKNGGTWDGYDCSYV